MTTPTLADLIASAQNLSSRVLDTYRGRGQPKVQVEMASLLRSLAAEAALHANSDPVLTESLKASEAELQDLRNQMFDFGYKAREFTPADQLQAMVVAETTRADAAEKRIAEDSMCHGCKSKDVASRCSSCGKEW